MNLVTTIDGQRVTPLRAIPFLTDGVIDVVWAANLVAYPEDYDGPRKIPPVNAYRMDDFGHLTYLPHFGFEPLAAQEESEDRKAAREIKDFTIAPPGI